MSISTLAALAVARNLPPTTAGKPRPTKQDAGESVAPSAKADEKASLTTILAKTVPTGLVAAYTAFIAGVTEQVDKPTKKVPSPDLYTGYRWVGFAVLVGASVALFLASYLSKADADHRKIPVPELLSILIVATAWGLAVPESPILASGDKQLPLLLLITFAAVAINGVLAQLMRKPAD